MVSMTPTPQDWRALGRSAAGARLLPGVGPYERARELRRVELGLRGGEHPA
jgi:hypothetical protein